MNLDGAIAGGSLGPLPGTSEVKGAQPSFVEDIQSPASIELPSFAPAKIDRTTEDVRRPRQQKLSLDAIESASPEGRLSRLDAVSIAEPKYGGDLNLPAPSPKNVLECLPQDSRKIPATLSSTPVRPAANIEAPTAAPTQLNLEQRLAPLKAALAQYTVTIEQAVALVEQQHSAEPLTAAERRQLPTALLEVDADWDNLNAAQLVRAIHSIMAVSLTHFGQEMTPEAREACQPNGELTQYFIEHARSSTPQLTSIMARYGIYLQRLALTHEPEKRQQALVTFPTADPEYLQCLPGVGSRMQDGINYLSKSQSTDMCTGISLSGHIQAEVVSAFGTLVANITTAVQPYVDEDYQVHIPPFIRDFLGVAGEASRDVFVRTPEAEIPADTLYNITSQSTPKMITQVRDNLIGDFVALLSDMDAIDMTDHNALAELGRRPLIEALAADNANVKSLSQYFIYDEYSFPVGWNFEALMADITPFFERALSSSLLRIPENVPQAAVPESKPTVPLAEYFKPANIPLICDQLCSNSNAEHQTAARLLLTLGTPLTGSSPVLFLTVMQALGERLSTSKEEAFHIAMQHLDTLTEHYRAPSTDTDESKSGEERVSSQWHYLAPQFARINDRLERYLGCSTEDVVEDLEDSFPHTIMSLQSSEHEQSTEALVEELFKGNAPFNDLRRQLNALPTDEHFTLPTEQAERLQYHPERYAILRTLQHHLSPETLGSFVIEAAKTGDVGVFNALIGAGVDNDTLLVTNADGVTSMHIAAEYGHLDIVRCLHEHGLPLEQPDGHGRTFIHFAVLGDQRKIIDYAVAQGVSKDFLLQRSEDQDSALMDAIRLDSTRALSALLDAEDISVDEVVALAELPGVNAFYWAAQHDSVGVIPLLIDLGAPPAALNERNIHQGTPMQVAVEQGHSRTIKALCARGVPIAELKKYLHLAADLNQAEVMETMINIMMDHGMEETEVMDVDHDGDTPAHYAAENNASDVLLALHRGGISLDTLLRYNADGKTIIDIAKEGCLPDVITAVVQLAIQDKRMDVLEGIRNKSMVNAMFLGENSEGKNILSLALTSKNADVIALFSSVDPVLLSDLIHDTIKSQILTELNFVEDNDFVRQLIAVAVQQREPLLIQLLVHGGASEEQLMQPNTEGDNVAHLAAKAGCSHICEELMRQGVSTQSLSLANQQGLSPLDLAVQHNRPMVISAFSNDLIAAVPLAKMQTHFYRMISTNSQSAFLRYTASLPKATLHQVLTHQGDQNIVDKLRQPDSEGMVIAVNTVLENKGFSTAERAALFREITE